jgi:ribosomal protein L37E
MSVTLQRCPKCGKKAYVYAKDLDCWRCAACGYRDKH